jgi:phage gp29-like protein
MPDNLPATMPAPDTGELTARTDDFALIAGPYVNLLTPDDTVLIWKGGDYALYRETLRDDACMAPFAQRRLAVTKCELAVDAGGDDALSKAAADWMREQIQELEWDRITDGMLFARWYGHAVAECLYQPNLTEGKVTLADIRVRDRSRFAYANDRGPPFIWDKAAGKWIRLPERKMWTLNVGADHDDSPYGLGLAHYCYWPVFFKRNNIKFWLIFLEKFGMPTAVAKMPAGQFKDEAQKRKVREAMQAMASETGVILPEGTEFEFVNALRSGTQDYDTMRAAMDNALAKVIIGQTASQQGTPGKLGNEDLQGEVKNDLVKADADLVCGSFNRTVATWLTEWNFPGAKPPRVWRVVDPPESLNEIADRDGKIYALGWERDDESFRATYGEGWQRKAVVDTGLPPNELAAQAVADFAELGVIASMRNGHRSDQQALVDAATAFANRYTEHLGGRVQELLDYAETSQDFETFRTKLQAMMAEEAPKPLADGIMRGGVMARLMGMWRGQRA